MSSPCSSQARLHSLTLWWEKSLPEHKRSKMLSFLQLNALNHGQQNMSKNSWEPTAGLVIPCCIMWVPFLKKKKQNPKHPNHEPNGKCMQLQPWIHRCTCFVCCFALVKTIVSFFFMQESTHYVHCSIKLETRSIIFGVSCVFFS